MSRWLWLLILSVGATVLGAEEVPIYEREVPTDPVEAKKYYAELEQALKALNNPAPVAPVKSAAPEQPRPRGPVDLAIPERDEDEIAVAARRVLTEQTLPADLANLVAQLRDGLDEESVANADQVLKLYPANSLALANAAAIAWVQEAPGPALLLAAEAAQRAPASANAVNTLGSLLADAGYASRGIPLLAYLAKKYPDDPTLQNNLGQAWLGIGDIERATPFLLACLSRSPGHGSAHAALGVIASSKGDSAAATKHFQAAAASTSSPLSRRALDQQGERYTLPRSFRRLAPVQEYFNAHEFVPPDGQTSLGEAETKRSQLRAFNQLLTERMGDAESALYAASSNLAEEMERKSALDFAESIAPATGLANLDLKHAASAFADRPRINDQFTEDTQKFLAESVEAWNNAEAKVEQIRQAFITRWTGKEVGEGGADNAAYIAEQKRLCDECRQIMEAVLPPIGQQYNQLVLRVATRERVALNEELTYLPLIFGGDAYRHEFYARVMTYLQRMGMLAGFNVVREYECGPPLVPGPFQPADGDLPSPGPCPFNLNVDVVVAKLKANCKSVGFEFKAGLKFSATKDFSSGETTLKGGVGAELDLAGVGQVGGDGGFVVVWDRGNSLSFIGVESSAGASLSGIPGLEGSIDTGDGTSVGGSVPGPTPDLVNVSSETRLGVTLGPRGVEPTLSGSSGAEVLGRDLVRASL